MPARAEILARLRSGGSQVIARPNGSESSTSTTPAASSWEWQRGTNPYAGISGGTYGGEGGDTGENFDIDYQNATSLIGTNASDALYGDWLMSRQQNFGSQATGFQSIGGIRGQATTQNAQFVRQALQQIYPQATQAQLDEAAAKALSKRGSHWHEVINPNDIVRAIGTEMGGLPERAESWLQSTDARQQERLHKITEARNNSDDASSGVSGFLNDLGPISMMAAAAFPALAPYVAGANAIAGLETGNLAQAAIGAYGAYTGFTGSGNIFNQAGNSVSNSLGLTPGSTLGNAVSSGVSGAITGTISSGSLRDGLINGVASAAGAAAGTSTGNSVLGGVVSGGTRAGLLNTLQEDPADREVTSDSSSGSTGSTGTTTPTSTGRATIAPIRRTRAQLLASLGG